MIYYKKKFINYFSYKNKFFYMNFNTNNLNNKNKKFEFNIYYLYFNFL